MTRLRMFTLLIFFLLGVLYLVGAERGVIISAYQGPCQDGDFDANLATVTRVVQEALSRRSDFLCFPETFLSGYTPREAVLRGAVKLDDPRLATFIRSTSAHDMVVLVGTAERLGDDLLNTQLVIHKGALLGTYSKIMLTEGDQKIFQQGQTVRVFQAKGITFACIICADSSYPETALLARHQGAILLFSPHYNSIAMSGMDHHRIWVRNNHIGIAALTRMVVVRSNVINMRANRLGYGDSAIFDPWGVPLVEAPLFKEALITTEISPETLDACRNWSYLERIPQEMRERLNGIWSAKKP